MLNNIVAQLGTGAGGGGGAFESIATVSGTGSSNTITLSSIPSTYQHLELRWIARDDQGAVDSPFFIRFNSDTGSNYAGLHYLYGDGSSVSAGSAAVPSATLAYLERTASGSATANVVGAGLTTILDYASTSKYKTIRNISGVDNNGSGTMWLTSALWMSSSAINRIDITTSGLWQSNTKFALYGIKGS